MKPINISDEKVTKLFEELVEKFKASITGYAFNSDTTITLKTNFSEVAKEKVKLIYSQSAYLRMKALVDYFSTEVAWYGLCQRLNEKAFYIYDVKICKQYVNGAKVDTEDEDTLEFFSQLTDEEAEHMHFQAHSHVRMSTEASDTDSQNQEDVVRNMGKEGYYIFQIWNKSGDINTYLYDLDNNVFYDRKDVEIVVEDELGTLCDYINSVKNLVVEKKNYPYQWTNQQPKNVSSVKKNTQDEIDEDEFEKMCHNGWYGWNSGAYGYERWDY